MGNELAKNTISVVLAGGRGERLGPLTRRVCKPALPFGGNYRSIDFSLANCVNSEISRIGVATQYKSEVLVRHVERVWGGADGMNKHRIETWPGQQRVPGLGYRGTADAVFRNWALIEASGRRLVLILAGDHVYKMDYRRMLQHHVERGAEATVGCVQVPVEEASAFGVISADESDRIRHFVEKPSVVRTLPESPGDVLASMGIYVFNAGFLGRELRRDALANQSTRDFGHDILPQLIRRARVYAYPFREIGTDRTDYWRDIGSISAYWHTHLELLGPSPSLRLDDPTWPLREDERALAHLGPIGDRRAQLVESVLGNNCIVSTAMVQRSVLSSNVRVGADTKITDSVVLPNTVIGSGCELHGVVIDSGARIPDGVLIGQEGGNGRSILTQKPIVVTQDGIWTDTEEIQRIQEGSPVGESVSAADAA